MGFQNYFFRYLWCLLRVFNMDRNIAFHSKVSFNVKLNENGSTVIWWVHVILLNFYSSYRYKLLLVDDFTMYFLNEKSEVFSEFLEFKETVKRMLNSMIKEL